MRTYVLIAAAAALPLLAAADNPPPQPAATTVAHPTISQERLNQFRQSIAAQIAVYDAAEGAMRAPSAAEAAALAHAGGPATSQAITLANGGKALRADVSQLSFARAVRQPDGTFKVVFDEKGARDDR